MSEKAMQQSAEAPQLDSAPPDRLPAAASPQHLLALYAEALRFDSAHPETCHPPDNLPAPASPQQLLALFAETMARETATTGQSLPPPWSDEHFAILWGPNWPGHPFRQPPLLWHKDLLEPDVTQLVQLFCRDDFAGKLGWRRRKAFLRALWDVQDCHSTGAKLPQLPSDDNIYKRMRCTAEHAVRSNEGDGTDATTEEIVSSNEELVSSNKNDSTGTDTRNMLRLDLFFSADKDKDGCEFHYAVEIKFEALVDNNFEAYNSFVCKKYKPCRRPACCLTVLGLDSENISGKLQENNNKCCFPIAEWHQFLKAWEDHIHAIDDSDPQFAQFRKSIWLKILRRDYVRDLCYDSAHLQAVPQA